MDTLAVGIQENSDSLENGDSLESRPLAYP